MDREQLEALTQRHLAGEVSRAELEAAVRASLLAEEAATRYTVPALTASHTLTKQQLRELGRRYTKREPAVTLTFLADTDGVPATRATGYTNTGEPWTLWLAEGRE